MKRKITAILFTAISLLVVSCGKNSKNENAENKEVINKDFLSTVKTVKAVLSDQIEELTLTGKVEYDPDKVINYVPLISGVVEKTYFSLGDKVQKGQVLAEIRSTELSMLQSELISLESEVKITQRELKSAQSLYEDNMLSEKELFEAESKLQQAQTALQRVKTDMSVFGSSKGDGIFLIKASMTGYIVNKNASSGSTISSGGEILFTIADLNTVWITANVYPSNLMFVKEGMNVKITTVSYPGEEFSGKINTLSQVFDPEERVLKARTIMPNTNMKFKPEMSVVVKLHNENPNQLITVPSDALIFDDNQYFVVVKESPEKFIVKEVRLQRSNKKVSYIASGIKEGDLIVTENQLLIYSKLKKTL